MSDKPADVIELLEDFLLHEPRWAFRLDDEDRAFAIRSMLPFNARFPRGGGRTFTIKDILTYENTVKVGDKDARDVLMLHLLCAAYLDGALPGQSFFCVYPSSTPAKGNPQLAGFLDRAKNMTGSSYKEDLLERVSQAPGHQPGAVQEERRPVDGPGHLHRRPGPYRTSQPGLQE
ncbi:hypothetical protein ACH4C6_35645 [Streptomyces sp. NPDC017943]|uniref:hypothetical protein n=1 Tax=Streptomyces sp. NPDC017943 TaxID=3365019 RepID=UPI003791EF3A